MDDSVCGILADNIEKPVEMIELLSSSNLIDGTTTNVASISCHPGTPILLTFPNSCVVFKCGPGARIQVKQYSKEFNLDELFQDDRVMYAEQGFICRIPLHHLLEGPHGDCFYSNCLYIDTISLIGRLVAESLPVLAAIVLTFHDSLRFGFSAAHESHFSYCYNEHCGRLVSEATQSSKHFVSTIVRPGSSTREIRSMLWMVE